MIRFCIMIAIFLCGIVILMTEIINFCKKRGFHKIVLGAQEHALNFYKKLGFEIISERYMDANIPHFKMQFSPSPLAGEGIFRCEKRASEKLGEGRTPLHRLSIDEEGGATSESFLTPHLNF